MKTFSYSWDEEYFLLHLQVNKREGQEFRTELTRTFRDGARQGETIAIKPEGASHRFLVTRTHPREIAFTYDYPDDVILEAFKLDDRAYYPTESFFKG